MVGGFDKNVMNDELKKQMASPPVIPDSPEYQAVKECVEIFVGVFPEVKGVAGSNSNMYLTMILNSFKNEEVRIRKALWEIMKHLEKKFGATCPHCKQKLR